MEESHTNADNIKDRYRELLSNLTGIFAANVDIAEDGSIREIHILGSQSRNPKQIARDVQSALASAFDIRIDHRIISIAQIPSDPVFKQGQEEYNTASAKESSARFLVEGIWQTVQNKQYTIKVTLRFGNHVYEGSSSCGNTFAQRMRAASMATLEAVHNYFGTRNVFILLSVEQMHIAGTRISLAAIECSGPGNSCMLVGSAVYNQDETNTVIRATLSAINRKLTFMAPDTV